MRLPSCKGRQIRQIAARLRAAAISAKIIDGTLVAVPGVGVAVPKGIAPFIEEPPIKIARMCGDEMFSQRVEYPLLVDIGAAERTTVRQVSSDRRIPMSQGPKPMHEVPLAQCAVSGLEEVRHASFACPGADTYKCCVGHDVPSRHRSP
jgi:hypothetical protein